MKQEGFFIVTLHGAAEIIAQHIEQLHFGRAIHGNRDLVALADTHGHNLQRAGQIRAAGAHFQGAGGVGIAAGQMGQTACGAQQHGEFILQGIGKGFHGITPGKGRHYQGNCTRAASGRRYSWRPADSSSYSYIITSNAEL